MMGSVKGNGHVAFLGKIPGIQRGHLFLDAAAGMRDHHGGIACVLVKAFGMEDQSGDAQPGFEEGRLCSFVIMGVGHEAHAFPPVVE